MNAALSDFVCVAATLIAQQITMIEPHYLKYIMSFTYCGCKIEIERDELNGQFVYAAWVNHEDGCAVAVPCAVTPTEAVKKAKQWIDKRF